MCRWFEALLHVALLAVVTALPMPVASQTAGGGEGLSSDGDSARASLERRLEELESTAILAGLPEDERRAAERRAAVLRFRLERGDFQPGDHVVVRVEGESELSDTFPVQPGPAIDLPGFGRIELEGTLRAELPGLVAKLVSRRIIDPRVETDVLVRLSVRGGVMEPGFYLLPVGHYLTDALMAAGGPVPGADPSKVSVERGGQVVWGGEEGREGDPELYTVPIGDLGLRTGDEILVPGGGRGALRTVLEVALGVAAIASLFLAR